MDAATTPSTPVLQWARQMWMLTHAVLAQQAARAKKGHLVDIKLLAIADVVLIKPRRFRDNRGWFEETWNAARFADAGLPLDFVQDNQSLSQSAGTLRGLHFQRPPHAQAKLVRVSSGVIFDVAVDLRQGSATYGQWVGATLTAEGGEQLLVPRGFAHGFLTRTPNSIVTYKVDGLFNAESDGGLAYDDPDLAIDWGIAHDEITVSPKDAGLPKLASLGAIFE